MLILRVDLSSVLIPMRVKGLLSEDGFGPSFVSCVAGVVEGDGDVLWGVDGAGEDAEEPPSFARRLLRICRCLALV